MQKPLASAIQKKSTEGFFLAGMFYSFLPINKERMEARLSNMQKPSASAIPKKIQGGIFLGHTPDWKGGAAGHRNEVRRLERKRNPGKRVAQRHGGRL